MLARYDQLVYKTLGYKSFPDEDDCWISFLLSHLFFLMCLLTFYEFMCFHMFSCVYDSCAVKGYFEIPE